MNLSTFNFNRWPKACLLAIILFCATVVLGALYLIKVDALPAPMFTGRVSADEKIGFLRKKYPIDADVVTIGASAALNNFSSRIFMYDPVIKQKYFNFSSWGLQMQSIFDYWLMYEKIHDAKIVIIGLAVSNFDEVNHSPVNINDILRYIRGDAHPLFNYLKYHKSGFGARIKLIYRNRKRNDTVASLKFDEAGGVVLNAPVEPIEALRWPNEIKKSRYHSDGYEALDQMLAKLKKEGKKAVIVQSPFKGSHLIRSGDFTFVFQHWEKLRTIVNKHNMYFYNMFDYFEFHDDLFADDAHLNEEGADLFTEKLVEYMKSDGIFTGLN